MSLKPVRRIRLSAQIEEQLKQQILNGKWKAGERLPSEHELSEIFQVSRVSIRQALQSLSAQGLIETRSGDGSYVKQPSIGDFVQGSIPGIYLADDSLRTVMEFRRLFEGPVAELAAARAEEAQIHQLGVLYHGMADTASNISENSSYDFEFHMLIGKMTQNAMIEGIYRVQNTVMRSCWKNIGTAKGTTDGLYYHGRLLEAFRRRDAAACRQIMEEHVNSTWSMFFE
ncbi:FadR/GntR family transcriptional regulator [Oscillibacter sp.]|uniref:FadR/GntR family transcriptional regulator n=1 Tax=Oscillibacter sp. TaxID=1945593 RepID=UPI00260E4D09|nr:FadR/GntR family transcriptional regulator [Oscillibacter sp.]MDD3347197.1 FadR/GntR family transcriptional regulator [Oscillibacter sp.]